MKGWPLGNRLGRPSMCYQALMPGSRRAANFPDCNDFDVWYPARCHHTWGLHFLAVAGRMCRQPRRAPGQVVSAIALLVLIAAASAFAGSKRVAKRDFARRGLASAAAAGTRLVAVGDIGSEAIGLGWRAEGASQLVMELHAASPLDGILIPGDCNYPGERAIWQGMPWKVHCRFPTTTKVAPVTQLGAEGCGLKVEGSVRY